MKRVVRLLLLGTILCWPLLVVAGFKDGVTAYNRGDYAAAYRAWRPLAEQGSARAQYNLGVMYANGQGVPETMLQAARWYRLAADQGYASAQHNLGIMYVYGQGVLEDDVQAHAWFSLAAAQGNAKAREAREHVAASMTRAEIIAAQELAREFWEAYVVPLMTGVPKRVGHSGSARFSCGRPVPGFQSRVPVSD